MKQSIVGIWLLMTATTLGLTLCFISADFLLQSVSHAVYMRCMCCQVLCSMWELLACRKNWRHRDCSRLITLTTYNIFLITRHIRPLCLLVLVFTMQMVNLLSATYMEICGIIFLISVQLAARVSPHRISRIWWITGSHITIYWLSIYYMCYLMWNVDIIVYL